MLTVDVLVEQRVLRWFVNFIAVSGLFISRDKVAKRYLIAMSTFGLSVLGAMSYTVIVFLEDMTALAVVLHHYILVADFIITIIYFYLKRNVVRRLLIDMTKSFDYDNYVVSRFLDDLQDKRVRSMERAFKLLMFMTVYMQTNLVIFGFVEKYTGDTEYALLFPCWFPFDLSYLPFHITAFAWQFAIAECVGLAIFGMLAFIYAIRTHLITQIALLKFAIEKSKERAYEIAARNGKTTMDFCYEEKDIFINILRRCYIKGTTQCVKHHLAIIEYYMNAREICKMVFFIVFATGLVLTAAGFALISDNKSLKIKFMGVTFIQFVCLYVFCWFGEKICDEGESIRLSIYGTEWYDMPKECQVSFKLMVERSLKPLVFTTLTGQRVDLVNFMSMINASYSYFNLMLATQQRQ